jgi:hypothetical protein
MAIHRDAASKPLRAATAVLAFAGALIALGLIADQSQAKGSSKNPLAGQWKGMTEPTLTWAGPPAPISFQITNAGYVVHLTTTVALVWSNNPSGCSSATTPVSMPAVKLNKPVPAFPKGKRFDYSSAGPGLVFADGKVITARKMEGGLLLRRVEVSPGLVCGTGNVHYTVSRKG